MRQLCPALGIVILLAGWVNLAGAQTPAPVPTPDYPSPLAVNTTNLDAGLLPDSGLDAQPWSVNLLLGFPTGVRVQNALGDGVGRDWLVEGFGGLELIFPMAGGGIRRRFTPFCGIAIVSRSARAWMFTCFTTRCTTAPVGTAGATRRLDCLRRTSKSSGITTSMTAAGGQLGAGT
jgi:hypothetical protein